MLSFFISLGVPFLPTCTCTCVTTVDGRLYSWGQNSDGQLGHSKDRSHVGTPTVIQSLEGLPIVKIAAGKAHNLVLSKADGVFAWGRNK